jgi:hypothetical protein
LTAIISSEASFEDKSVRTLPDCGTSLVTEDFVIEGGYLSGGSVPRVMLVLEKGPEKQWQAKRV